MKNLTPSANSKKQPCTGATTAAEKAGTTDAQRAAAPHIFGGVFLAGGGDGDAKNVFPVVQIHAVNVQFLHGRSFRFVARVRLSPGCFRGGGIGSLYGAARQGVRRGSKIGFP